MTIHVGDEFLSNGGRGPWRAVVKMVDGDKVCIEWWGDHTKGKKRHATVLTARYLEKVSDRLIAKSKAKP